MEGFGVDGPSDAEEVADFVEVDGAVGGSSVALVGYGGGGGRVVEVGYVEDKGVGEGGDEEEEEKEYEGVRSA